MRSGCLMLAVSTAFTAVGLQETCASEVLFDFESAGEIAQIDAKPVAGRHQCVTNDFATSGTNAVVFMFEPWLSGDWKYPACPQLVLRVPERLRDWTRFECLSIDIVNFGDIMFVYSMWF